MARAKTFAAGTRVKVKPDSGRHSGKIGIVEHSDKSITTVKFEEDKWSDPVWTNALEEA